MSPVRNTRPYCLLMAPLTPYAATDTNMMALAEALERKGINTKFFLDVRGHFDPQFTLYLLEELFEYKGPRFLIEMNGQLGLAPVEKQGRKISPYDDQKCPRLSVLGSHPLDHMRGQPYQPVNQIYAVQDPAHQEVLEVLKYRCRDAFALPPAGPPPLPKGKVARDRPIDVLFVGNLGPTPPWNAWLAEFPASGAERDLVEQVAGLMLEEPQHELLPLLRQAREERGLPPDACHDCGLERRIEAYLSTVWRKETLASLHGLRVHVHGRVNGPLPLPPNVILGEPIPFVDVLAAMDDSKVVLALSSTRRSVHEQVFHGLSRGAVVVSEVSTLLEPGAGDEGGVVFRASSSDVGEQMRELIGDCAGLDRRREAGQAWYLQAHTWDQRAETVIAHMQPFLDEQRS